jgi:hypothetical protein
MMRTALLASLVLLGVFLEPGPSGAAAGKWVSYADGRMGFRIAIPSSWYLVPNSVSKVQALAKRYALKDKDGPAAVYSSMIATAATRKQLEGYSFQAFAYSPAVTTQTDVALAIARTPRTYTKHDLRAVDASVRKSLAAERSHVTEASVVALPAGDAAVIEGTTAGGGGTSRFAVYVISHSDRLFELTCRADARSAPIASTCGQIAARFRAN